MSSRQSSGSSLRAKKLSQEALSSSPAHVLSSPKMTPMTHYQHPHEQLTPMTPNSYQVHHGHGMTMSYRGADGVTTSHRGADLNGMTTSFRGTEILQSALTGNETILGERVVEHEVKVPKRIIREEIIEKVVVVPEKVVCEEVIEEIQKVRERIIEVAKPIYQEKIIEMPEIEYVEKIVEVIEKVIQEKIREVPVVQIQERIVEVPKIITQERVVEVPEYEYIEVPVERVVEVPEIREEYVVKEVSVPQYVDKPVPEYRNVEVPVKISRNIPIPVEAVSTFEYRLPHIRPNYKKSSFPVYVPRFVEVPVPEELVSGMVGEQASQLAQHVSVLTSQTAPSMCEIENIAADLKKLDLANHIASSDYHATIREAWAAGALTARPRDAYQARSRAGSSVQGKYVPVVHKVSTPSTSPKSYRGTSHVSRSHKGSHRGSVAVH